MSLQVSVDAHFVPQKKMQKLPDFKRARLVQSNYKKGWYIQFYVWHVQKNELIRKKKFIPPTYSNPDSKKAYARDFIKKINLLLKKGYHIDNNREQYEPEETIEITLTIKAAIPKYIKYCTNITKNSQKEINSKLNLLINFSNWLKENNYPIVYLNELTTEIVQQYFDYEIIERGIGAKTHNNNLSQLRNFYNVALKRKWVKGKSPFSDIEKQYTNYGEKNIPLTQKQLQEIIPYIKEQDEYLYKFICFIYYTLMRPAEIRRLKISNIDFENHALKIYASQSKVKRFDIIPISDDLMKVIQSMELEKCPAHYYLFSMDKEPSETQMGKYWSTAHFKKVKNHFNLSDNHSIYAFKHTAVCRWYEQTKDIVRIQRMCRHSSIEMTARYLKSLGLMTEEFKIDSLPGLL